MFSLPGDECVVIGDRNYFVDPSERTKFILDIIDYVQWSINAYEYFYATGEKNFRPLPKVSWRKRLGITEPLNIFIYSRIVVL